MHGFLCINKSLGVTSHDVVAAVRRVARQRDVGHAGTLDPAASGVLVVALGAATRLIEYVQDDTVKTYRATICFGRATDSDDATGTTIATSALPRIDDTVLHQLRTQFTGTIQQVPPTVSALHHQGQRMYDLARTGQAPQLPARPVHIYALTFEQWSAPYLTCTVSCGKGTYIRALARDIGAWCNSTAHLSQLERTAVGDFILDDAVTIAELQVRGCTDALLPLQRAVRQWHHVVLDDANIQRIRFGQRIACGDTTHTRAVLVSSNGELVAIALRHDDQWKPHKVFPRNDLS